MNEESDGPGVAEAFGWGSGAGHGNLIPPRILVVEDNPVNQMVALRMLTRLGYRADAVGNGVEALDAVLRTRYAAILMDCAMPVMDGYEATRRIRQTESIGHRLPIIAVTALAQPWDRQRCLAAGMDDYVSKPIRAATLAMALDRWIHAHAC